MQLGGQDNHQQRQRVSGNRHPQVDPKCLTAISLLTSHNHPFPRKLLPDCCAAFSHCEMHPTGSHIVGPKQSASERLAASLRRDLPNDAPSMGATIFCRTEEIAVGVKGHSPFREPFPVKGEVVEVG